MELTGLPPGILTLPFVLERLKVSNQRFYKSGLSDLFNFYQVGRTKLYLTREVNKVQYWLFCRRGLIALGHLPRNHPLLPPGDDPQAQWTALDVWFEEDPNGVECPKCGEAAVQAACRKDERVWCAECGVMS